MISVYIVATRLCTKYVLPPFVGVMYVCYVLRALSCSNESCRVLIMSPLFPVRVAPVPLSYKQVVSCGWLLAEMGGLMPRALR